MDAQELRGRVADLVAQRAGTERDLLLADTPFKDLGYDSLMVIEISFFLEESLKIEFGDQVTAQNLPRNLSDVVKLVQAVQDAPPKGAGAR